VALRGCWATSSGFRTFTDIPRGFLFVPFFHVFGPSWRSLLMGPGSSGLAPKTVEQPSLNVFFLCLLPCRVPFFPDGRFPFFLSLRPGEWLSFPPYFRQGPTSLPEFPFRNRLIPILYQHDPSNPTTTFAPRKTPFGFPCFRHGPTTSGSRIFSEIRDSKECSDLFRGVAS